MYRRKFGIIGGGQLGKLLIDSNPNESYLIYSPTKPLKTDTYTEHFEGDYQDQSKLKEFAQRCRLITYELENINADALIEIQSELDVPIYPDPKILKLIQNKADQKHFLQDNQFPTCDFLSYQNREELDLSSLTYSIIIKTQRGGYDGYGVKHLPYHQFQLDDFFDQPSIIEPYLTIQKELSIIVARSADNTIITFPIAEMVFNPDTHQLDYLISPAQNLTSTQTETITNLGTQLANKLELIGLLAIELFLTTDNQILINELSPRPHNSGHQTIHSTDYSQYRAVYDAITNDSLRPPNINPNICLMINLMSYQELTKPKFHPTCFNHSDFELTNYQKPRARPNRKMGHLTYQTTHPNLTSDQISKLILQMKNSYRLIGTKPQSNPSTNSRLSSSSSPLSSSTQQTISSASTNFLHSSTNSPHPSRAISSPQVVILMGSKSDLPTLQPALEILQDFQVPYQIRVLSAHRTPQEMIEFATNLTDTLSTIEVIIAGAGGSAHLPGMVASCTTLPVIGVPIRSSNSIQGIDSLLSIVQMPSGIPVSTMSINGALNAGLMAIRILATHHRYLAKLMEIYQCRLKQKVEQMNQEISQISEYSPI